MYCNNCGTQVEDGQKFCPNCGSPLGAGPMPTQVTAPIPTSDSAPTPTYAQPAPQAPAPAPASAPAKPSRATTIRNIVILVAGIVAIVTGIFKIYRALSPSSVPEPAAQTQTEDLPYAPPESSEPSPGISLDGPAPTPSEPTTTEPTTTEPTSNPEPTDTTTSTVPESYEVTGIIVIMNSDDLAESGGVDPAAYDSSDRYAIFLIDDPVQMSLQNGDGSGLRDPETVAIICVGSTQMGNLSDWEPYEGQTEHITVRIDPYTTWWPSDVSLPVGQPSTSTATVVG